MCCVCGCRPVSEIHSLAWAVLLGWKGMKTVCSDSLFDTSSRRKSGSKDSTCFCIAKGLTGLLVEPHERELGGSSALMHQNWHGALYTASSAHKWWVVTDDMCVATSFPGCGVHSLVGLQLPWLCSALSAEGYAICSLSSTQQQLPWASCKDRWPKTKVELLAFWIKHLSSLFYCV